ncbi:MAG TPA: DUF418 domain-containing protein [Burkholderiaceae bacterium]|nr:DUF418 domain-containing protein [Burkholderiaceae bacterium]
MIQPTTARDERIDALRGFALLGILLVNIQSFAWGGINPAGYLLDDATVLDRALFFATVAFINMKFMPLFAMLFGVGFSLLLNKLHALTDEPHAVFRRRMLFLFVFGMLHGILFYFGDITQMYAMAGMVLLLYDQRGVASLRWALVVWWCGAIGLAVLLTWGLAGTVADPADLAEELEANFAVFTQGSFLEQLPTRASLFLDIVLANVIGLPLVVALMLTGMLAHRSGWLADRGAGAWRTALVAGFALGLPSALIYGGLLYVEADRNGLGAFSAIAAVPGTISVTLAFAYAALFINRASPGMVAWLAPAGRMPLTNYLLQSVAMGALLSGWGLALAAQLGYAETALLAVVIFVVQLELSRWWLRRWKQGPLELAWRQWTYRGMAPRASSPIRSEE